MKSVQSQQRHAAAAGCCAGASDLQDLGDVLPHLHAADLWVEDFTINPACAAVDSKTFLWVWISVLGLVPRTPAAKSSEGNNFFAAWHQQRGVCSSHERQVSVSAVPAEDSDVSQPPHPWIQPSTDKATMTCKDMYHPFQHKNCSQPETLGTQIL